MNSGTLDDQFLDSYRNILFGQYRSLNDPVQNPKAREEADAILKLDEDKITWEDLYRLELALVKLEPKDALFRRAWTLRNEYKEVASPDEYKDYLDSNPPKIDNDVDLELLRADLVHLQEELNWRYIVIWTMETYRSQTLRGVVWRTLEIVVLALILVYSPWLQSWFSSQSDINLPSLALVILPGVVGGLISTIRRVQKAQFGKNADLDLAEMEKGNTNTYLSPFLGGVFALLLFFLFAGEFLTGTLVPKVAVGNLLGTGLEGMDSTELGKLVVWCFIAGFAEQLVPDQLEQITKNGATFAGGKPQAVDRNPA